MAEKGNVVEELVIQLTYETDAKPLKEASKVAAQAAKNAEDAHKDAAKAVEKAQEDLANATTTSAKKTATEVLKAAKKQEKGSKEALKATKEAAKEAAEEVDKAVADNAKAAEDFKDKWTDAGKFVGGALLAIGTAAVAGTAALVTNAIDNAREFDTWATKIGTTTEELQALEIGTAKFGVEADNVREGVKTLRENLGEMARVGSGPAVDSLKSLGIELEDIKDLDVEDQMAMLANAIKGVEDPAKQLSIATELMGDDGAALLPVLKQGGEAFREMGESARESGRIMSQETVDAALEVDEKFKDLRGELGATSNRILKNLLPAVGDAADGMSDWVDNNEEFIEQDLPQLVDTATDAVGELAGAFVAVAASIAQALSALEEFVTKIEDVDRARALAEGVSAESLDASGKRVGARGGAGFSDSAEAEAKWLESRGRGGEAKKLRADAKAKADAESAPRKADAAQEAAAAKASARENKRRGGGGRGKSAEQKQQEEDLETAFAHVKVMSDIGKTIQRQGGAAGASDKAIEKAMAAAAKSIVEGASDKVALGAGQKQLSRLTGTDVAKANDDPLSAILGLTQAPDVGLSSLTKNKQPDVMITTINNTYQVTVNNEINGSQEPVAVAREVGTVFRDTMAGELSTVSKFSKVNFAR